MRYGPHVPTNVASGISSHPNKVCFVLVSFLALPMCETTHLYVLDLKMGSSASSLSVHDFERQESSHIVVLSWLT